MGIGNDLENNTPMSWHDVKIDPADKNFSLFIRRRDKACAYRFKCYGLKVDIRELQCSHYQSRRHFGVRFDQENADASCHACHRYSETSEGKKALKEFKIRQLGEDRHTKLLIRMNAYTPRDWKLARIITKQMLKNQEHGA